MFEHNQTKIGKNGTEKMAKNWTYSQEHAFSSAVNYKQSLEVVSLCSVCSAKTKLNLIGASKKIFICLPLNVENVQINTFSDLPNSRVQVVQLTQIFYLLE